MFEGIFMSKNDQLKLSIINDFIYRRITRPEAAQLLDTTERTVTRMANKIRRQGIAGIKHGYNGKIPQHKINALLKADVEYLLKNDYYDFYLSHFKEMIIEKEGIIVGKNVIHRIASKNGLVKKPRRRVGAKKHKSRAKHTLH